MQFPKPSMWTSGLTCNWKSQFLQPLTQTYWMSLTSISTSTTTISGQAKNIWQQSDSHWSLSLQTMLFWFLSKISQFCIISNSITKILQHYCLDHLRQEGQTDLWGCLSWQSVKLCYWIESCKPHFFFSRENTSYKTNPSLFPGPLHIGNGVENRKNSCQLIHNDVCTVMVPRVTSMRTSSLQSRLSCWQEWGGKSHGENSSSSIWDWRSPKGELRKTAAPDWCKLQKMRGINKVKVAVDIPGFQRRT